MKFSTFSTFEEVAACLATSECPPKSLIYKNKKNGVVYILMPEDAADVGVRRSFDRLILISDARFVKSKVYDVTEAWDNVRELATKLHTTELLDKEIENMNNHVPTRMEIVTQWRALLTPQLAPLIRIARALNQILYKTLSPLGNDERSSQDSITMDPWRRSTHLFPQVHAYENIVLYEQSPWISRSTFHYLMGKLTPLNGDCIEHVASYYFKYEEWRWFKLRLNFGKTEWYERALWLYRQRCVSHRKKDPA